MTPPKAANWLLDRLGIDPALVGDLLEESQSGRSQAWFWRQTFRAVASGAARNGRVRGRHLFAAVAGWSVQFCVALAIQHYHLTPQSPGILWRIAEGILMLLAAALYGASCRLVFGSRSRAARGSLEVALDSLVTNLCVYGICLALYPFSLAGVIAAEIYWLCNDLSRVLFARNPA